MNPIKASSSASGAIAAGARVVAVGRAGMEVALALREANVPGLTYAVLDADGATELLELGEGLSLGSRLTRGMGAGGDPELARTAAEEELPAIRALCQGYSVVFIVAGLGGGSGTGIAPVVARVARETGASVFAFVTAPFACEGSRRQQQALVGLHRLKTVADGVLCLPNEKMLLLTDDRTTLLEALRSSRAHIRDAVTCVWGLLTRPGLLNVSFADLCIVLRGPNLESAFALVTSTGPDRAEEALRQILVHPLLAEGETLRRAEALLISFSAGNNLGMGETRRIVEELKKRADGARVVVGAAVDEAAGDTLTLTVIASTRQIVLHETGDESVSDRSEDGLPGTAGRDTEASPARTARGMVPPAPELSPEVADELLQRGNGRGRGRRKKPQQVTLPFEIIPKGRFEKCEPTVRRGHNLDQPTYLRRGVTLN